MSSTAVRTSHVGERILEKLAEFCRPMQLCEIVRAVGCNRSHCSNLLKQFVEHGLVVRLEELGKVLFRLASQPVRPPSQDACSPSQDAWSPSHHAWSPSHHAWSPSQDACSPSQPAWSPSHHACSPSQDACLPSQSAWSEALQSVDSSLKSIARTLESAFSAWTEAAREAGDAVGSLISPAPTAPADSRPAGNPNIDAAISQEISQIDANIDAAAAGACTEQAVGAICPNPPIPAAAAVSVEKLADNIVSENFAEKLADNINLNLTKFNQPMEKEISEISQAAVPGDPVEDSFSLTTQAKAKSKPLASRGNYRTSKIKCKQQETLFKIIGDPSKMDGAVFLTDTATDSLYFMLANMEGKTAADPYFVPEYDANLLPTNSPEALPMVEVFQKYLRLVFNAAKIHTKPNKPVYDFVLHRAAYLFTVQNVNELPYSWHDPESLVKVAMSQKGERTTVGGAMACELRKAFEYLGFGWDETILRNDATYSAELDNVRYKREVLGETNAMPRNNLFLSYMSQKLFRKKPAATNTQESITQPAVVNSDGNGNHLLTRIAEKVGEKRFALWFGTDTVCKVDEAKMQVVFSVRNEFAMKSIRTHLSQEVREVIAEHLPNGFRVFYES